MIAGFRPIRGIFGGSLVYWGAFVVVLSSPFDGWFVSRLLDWLVDSSLVGWLVGWLVDWSTAQLLH